MELLEIENRKHSEAEDSMSMMEFCAAYATGKKTTLAMRRALVRNQWRVDTYATTLVEFERRTEKKPQQQQAVEQQQELIKGPGKRWSRRQQILPQPVLPTQLTRLAVPGVVLSCANGFVYSHEPIRLAFGRIKAILENEGGFYFTPEHAFHVTVATLQKFNSENALDVDSVAASLRDNSALARECARGPFKLIVDSITIPDTGDAIVALFRDNDNRIRDLRHALQGKAAHIPQFIHTTLARVSSLPSCSREDLLKRIRGIAEGMEIQVQVMDLVVEEYFGYMEGFPFGVHVHWNFEQPEEEEAESVDSKATFWDWLDSDQAMYVALGLVVAAVATIVVK